MEQAVVVPSPFWFRWRFACPRVDALPAAGGDRLCPLPDSARLAAVSTLDGGKAWWEVRVGWSPAGLALAVESRDSRRPIAGESDEADLSDGLEVWIGTRDTKDVHRATQYCHRFLARVVHSPKRGSLAVSVEQRKIHRALADPRIDRQGDVRSRLGLLPDGWWLDLFFPAASLTGYDPETNPRLGFSYSLHDPIRGDRFLTVGRDFPIGEDPSLWATLELGGPDSPDGSGSAAPRKKKARPRAAPARD